MPFHVAIIRAGLGSNFNLRFSQELMIMWNYLALFLACVIGIVVLDDDPTSVSLQEWVLFAIMIYAAISFFRIYRDLISPRNR
jgi:hypothetical protein